MKRSEAREIVFSLLFEASFANEPNAESICKLAQECRDFTTDEYIVRAFEGALSSLDEIDAIIDKYSTKWKAERLSKVVLCALRLAIYEINNEAEVPSAVAVNEAVEIIKKYDGEESAKYANGILGSYVRENEK